MALRRDTPLPTLANVAATQELDACDILEVQDMAEAIARAEQPMKLARSAQDMFGSLGKRATDDTAGPATPAPLYVTSLTPLPAPMPEPRYVTMPSAPTVPEDDAYYHPAGRLRTLADATLENYRPEPTLLLRARSRRKRYSWVAVAVLLPVIVLAAFEISARAGGETTSPAATVATTAKVTATTTPVTTPAPVATTTSASTSTSSPKATPATASKPAKGAVPVFDVNSLPTVGGAKPKPHGR